MARVKRGNVAVNAATKSCGWPVASVVATEPCSVQQTSVMKALCNAYRDRRRRKRDFRRLWIARINAAARLNGVSYSRLMGGLKKADVRLNRKMLAQLAVVDPGSFTNVVAAAKS